MKKLLYLLFIMPALAFAQGNSPKIKPTEEYCELKLIATALNVFKNPDDLRAEIRFSGNENSKDKTLMDENGAPLKITSMSQTLNYMNERGWSLITAWPLGMCTTYIMKREVK